MRKRVHERRRRAAVAEDDGALARQTVEDRGVGRPALDASVADDERVHGRRVRLAEAR